MFANTAKSSPAVSTSWRVRSRRAGFYNPGSAGRASIDLFHGDLVGAGHGEYGDLGFDPDVLLFKEFGGDDFAGFTDRFDGHAAAFGRGVELVGGADDALGRKGHTVVLGELYDPTSEVLLFEFPLGIGENDGELLFYGGWSVGLFLFFGFELHFDLLHDLVDFADVRLVALENEF